MSAPLKIARDAKGKRPEFYEAPGLDQAMSMILVLANELSTMRDRVDTIERVSAARGIDLEAEIEAYEPTQQVLETREARRQDFLERLYYLARKDAAEQAGGDSSELYQRTLDEIATP